MSLLSDQELADSQARVHAWLLRQERDIVTALHSKRLPDDKPEDSRDRPRANKLRHEYYQNVDLLAKALEDPKSLNDVQRKALLGRPAYDRDATTFLRLLPGYGQRPRTIRCFREAASDFSSFAHYSPELCKFTLCDWRVPQGLDGTKDNATAAIESLYQEQLHLERENSPLELAREAVRNYNDRQARFYARRVLREYELAEE